jgi:hypothetical protein
MIRSALRSLPLAALAALAALAPARAQSGNEWWVIVGYVDHPPFEWTDQVLVTGNRLSDRLAACGLTAWWDFTGKFDGFATEGRGSVIVVSTDVPLTKQAASRLLTATKPCVGDAYIKAARYFGE